MSAPDFSSASTQAGWLEWMIHWALHPDRPRDAEYRLSELQEAWDDYCSQMTAQGQATW